MRNPEIVPSILAANPASYDQAFASIALAHKVHLDIMDGHFVPNMTFGPWMVHLAKKLFSGAIDVHLMVDEPQHIIPLYLEAGCAALSFHIETVSDPTPLLQEIRAHNTQAGLAINPKTPFDTIFSHLDELDFLVIMSVQAGFGGQAFKPESYARIEKCASQLRSRGMDIPIVVDGGVDETNAAQLVASGATDLVAGSSIFGRTNPEAALKELADIARSNT